MAYQVWLILLCIVHMAISIRLIIKSIIANLEGFNVSNLFPYECLSVLKGLIP